MALNQWVSFVLTLYKCYLVMYFCECTNMSMQCLNETIVSVYMGWEWFVADFDKSV